MNYDINLTIENYLKTFKVQPDFYTDSESSVISDESEYESLKPPMLPYEEIKDKMVRIPVYKEENENLTNIEEAESIKESCGEKNESDDVQMNRLDIRETDENLFVSLSKMSKKSKEEEYNVPVHNSFSLLSDCESVLVTSESKECPPETKKTTAPNKTKKVKPKKNVKKKKKKSAPHNKTKPETSGNILPILVNKEYAYFISISKVPALNVFLRSQYNLLNYLYMRKNCEHDIIKTFMEFMKTSEEMSNIIDFFETMMAVNGKSKELKKLKKKNDWEQRYIRETWVLDNNKKLVDYYVDSNELQYLQRGLPKVASKNTSSGQEMFQYLVDCVCPKLCDNYHEIEMKNNKILEECFINHNVREIISNFVMYFDYCEYKIEDFDVRISLNFLRNIYSSIFYDSIHNLTKTPIDLFASYDLQFDSVDHILSEINKYSSMNENNGFFSSHFRNSNYPSIVKTNTLQRQLFYCKRPPNNKNRFDYMNMLQMVGIYPVELMSKSKRKRIRKANQKLVSKNNNSNNQNCCLVFNSSPLQLTEKCVKPCNGLWLEESNSGLNFKDCFTQVSVLFLLLYFIHFIFYGPVNC